MSKPSIEAEIDKVIDELSTPVSSSESLDGWTPESKKAIKLFFEDLKKKLQTDEKLPPLSISRALDHWGVVGGPLLEKSAHISNELRLSRKIN